MAINNIERRKLLAALIIKCENGISSGKLAAKHVAANLAEAIGGASTLKISGMAKASKRWRKW